MSGKPRCPHELNKGFAQGRPEVPVGRFGAGTNSILNSLKDKAKDLVTKDFLPFSSLCAAMERRERLTTFKTGRKEPVLRTGALGGEGESGADMAKRASAMSDCVEEKWTKLGRPWATAWSSGETASRRSLYESFPVRSR